MGRRLAAYPRSVTSPSDPRRPSRDPRRSPVRPRVLVVGDLVLDVVLAPDRNLERGTDVTGGVRMRQGGSASTTARWLGRLGARCTLVCAVGRDATGRSLVAAVGIRVDVRHATLPAMRLTIECGPKGKVVFGR
jgi:sugar/nucleoside kinase (ribokinase family)